MKKLLLLDKDGTIVRPTRGKFINEPWHQEAIEGVHEALTKAKSLYWDIKVCSNQAGVISGHKTLIKAFSEMQFCLELFPMISEIWFCPDWGETAWVCWGDCSEDHRIERHRKDSSLWYSSDRIIFPGFRKPEPGMLLAATNLEYDEIIFSGDRPEDEGAALEAGCPFIWAKDLTSYNF
jgi:D-glycero-D-manno-heptose 1,7-bisphosphate phosphatase